MPVTSSHLSKQDNNTTSATNFNLPSLYLLRSEINEVLDNAEAHLSRFNDDSEQAPLLLDSIDELTQLSAVLKLIALSGGSDLAEVLSASMLALHDAGDNSDDELILNLAQGIMALDRYIEFVLLKEAVEPSLLIPIINRLNRAIGRDDIDTDALNQRGYLNVSIANPEQNFVAVDTLDIDGHLLSTAYRSGLNVVLTHQQGALTEQQAHKVHAMAQACQVLAQHTDVLFWRAAHAVTIALPERLPLSSSHKRTLVFLEQQFKNYLPANDNRFADLVSMACQLQNAPANRIKDEFSTHRLSQAQYEQMKRHLFGPNQPVVTTLNALIQNETSAIKDRVDALARKDAKSDIKTDIGPIVDKLKHLSSVMQLINIDSAADAFANAANHVRAWQTPTPQDFDKLLELLMVGENESIIMAKSRSPGVITQSLYNDKISIYQLDTAFNTLVKESRTTIFTTEQAISDYLSGDCFDESYIADALEMIKQVAGACVFLGLRAEANLLMRLTNHVQHRVLKQHLKLSDSEMADIADVLMAVDHHLQGLLDNHPVSSRAMHIGHSSLKRLLAA